MFYYQHFIMDYRADTAHLSLLEHGVYRQLLDQYYLNEEPLTLDLIKLFRLLSARTKDEQIAIEIVLNDFFTKTEIGYTHKRCEIEVRAYQDRLKVASDSAQKRWNKEKSNNPMGTQCQPNAKHKQLTINNKTLNNINTIKQELAEYRYDNKSPDTLSSEFAIFWKTYPKKVGKEAARKSWDKIRPNIEEVLKALEWQMKSDQWFKNGGQFIPNPSTYLNQHRWEDEMPVSATF